MANLENPTCFKCGAALDCGSERVGRRETCNKCGADVHVCKNCKHYDPKSYNECREPQADRVVDKEKSNFCDYFALGGGNTGASSAKDAVLKELDNLFKR